ncbi:DUF5941 domain-containing protein [Micromonospora sp. BRA006-A]|nr:DUF5941 domain-containing protein [Micromonospora sp. BRA006-A]
MRVPVLTTVDAGLHRDDGLLARTLPTARRPLLLAVLGALGAAGTLVWALLAVHGGGDLPVWVPVLALVLLLGAAQASRSPHDGSLDWLVPAALRAAEYLFAIAVGWRPGAGLADLRVRPGAHAAALRPDGPAGEAAVGAAAARGHARLAGAVAAAGNRADRRICEYRSGYTRCVPSRGFCRERGPRLGVLPARARGGVRSPG